MNLSKEEKSQHKKATSCYVCNCDFTAENRKVRDQCHVLGNYQGAACNMCNSGMTLTKTIPVIFHNLKGYDSHSLLPELENFTRKYQSYRITCRRTCQFRWVIQHRIFIRKRENKSTGNIRITESSTVLGSWLLA